VAARLDRIARYAHTLSQSLKEGHAIRAADMPGADGLIMRIYAAMAQKERELISEDQGGAGGCRGAQGGAGRRSRLPACYGPDAAAAASARREAAGAAERVAHRRAHELRRLQAEGFESQAALARAPNARGVRPPTGRGTWSHTTIKRVLLQGGYRWTVAQLNSCRRMTSPHRVVRMEFQ
jgi:hypothetical protein